MFFSPLILDVYSFPTFRFELVLDMDVGVDSDYYG